jgi:hypothetical protein
MRCDGNGGGDGDNGGGIGWDTLGEGVELADSLLTVKFARHLGHATARPSSSSGTRSWLAHDGQLTVSGMKSAP